LLFVPLELIIATGAQVAPPKVLQDKTILLLQALKIVLPALGMCGVLWLAIPDRWRFGFHRLIFNVAASPRTMPTIVALAFLLRLGWVLYYPTQLYAESNWYFDKATAISRGHGYVYDLESLKPTAAWPVGYPAFLALIFRVTGPSILVAQLANVTLSTFSVYLTHLFALRTFGRTVAVLSALFMATLPGVIVYNSLVCSDVFFLTLVIGTLVLTIDPQDQPQKLLGEYPVPGALFTGLVNGALILTRSTGLILLPLWFWIRWLVVRPGLAGWRRWTLTLAFGTGFIVVPWTVRNYVHFQKLIPVSINGGMNFWIGNNSLAHGSFVFPRDEALNPLVSLIGDEMAVDETGYQAGLEFIREHPGQALKLLPAKVFYLFNSNDQGLHWNRLSAVSPDQEPGEQAFMVTNLVYTLLAIAALLGLLALILRTKTLQSLAWIGVIFSVYWTLWHLPFFGLDRFALPLLPFLTTYAALGVLSAIEGAGQNAATPRVEVYKANHSPIHRS
jgi:4-amino-4-deoxy-L-arabinose transferase-like glycosyltransferase